jgi:hypothetical protein
MRTVNGAVLNVENCPIALTRPYTFIVLAMLIVRGADSRRTNDVTRACAQDALATADQRCIAVAA